MKTYWDFTEQERAALTDEQVRELCKLELMGEGIIPPSYPGPAPERPVVDEPKVTVYQVTWKAGYTTESLCFEDREQALEAMKLRPVNIDHDYTADVDSLRPLSESSMGEREVYKVFDKESYSSQLNEYRSAKERHDKEVAEYNDDKKAADRCCEGLWEDYHEQCATLRKAKRVAERFAEYVQTCDGDRRIAAKFLEKAFEPEEIQQANEWADAGAPVVVEPVTAEAV